MIFKSRKPKNDQDSSDSPLLTSPYPGKEGSHLIDAFAKADIDRIIDAVGISNFIALQRVQAQTADILEHCVLHDERMHLPKIDIDKLANDPESTRLAALWLENKDHPEISALNLRAVQGMAWLVAYAQAEDFVLHRAS